MSSYYAEMNVFMLHTIAVNYGMENIVNLVLDYSETIDIIANERVFSLYKHSNNILYGKEIVRYICEILIISLIFTNNSTNNSYYKQFLINMLRLECQSKEELYLKSININIYMYL